MSKFKMLIMVMISSFIGIFANPEMLTASDSVAVTGLNNSGVVETVVKPEPEPEPEPEPIYEPVYEPTYYVARYEEPVYQMPANYIQIYGLTIPLDLTAGTYENAGAAQQAWYHQSGHFIYGHNYGYVLGGLDTAYDNGTLICTSFTVSMNGATNTYTVVNYRLYNLEDDYTLGYNGKKYGMVPVINAYLDGTFYNMAIMTCYNGSAQRLVVYAN